MQPFFETDSAHPRIEMTGIAMRVLVPDSATGGALALFEETTAPGGGPPLHIHHRQVETFRVLEGRYEFLIDGVRHAAGPGDTAVVPAGAKHAFWNIGDGPARLLFALTPGVGAAAFFQGLEPYLGGDGPPDVAAINAVFAGDGFEIAGPPLAVMAGGRP